MPKVALIDLGTEGVNIIARETSSLANAKTAFEMLGAGPKRHGRERTERRFDNGETGDTYRAILYAVAKDPPTVSLPYEEIRKRIAATVDPAPQGQLVATTLAQMDKIVKDHLPRDRVLEWDEDRQVLDVVDPYFLFYLRWQIWPKKPK